MGFVACLLLSGIAGESRAGELTITPQMPKQGVTVSFRYKQDTLIFQGAPKELYVFVYSFGESSGQPRGTAVPLKREQGGIWTATTTTGMKDVFLMVKVSDGIRDDRNGGEFWESLMSNDGVKPVESSYLRSGIVAMGSLPDPCSRLVDLPLALTRLRKELIAYPNNVQAQVAVTSLAYELKDLDEKSYREQIQKILAAPVDSTRENYTRAIIRLLNLQNRRGEALKLEESFAKRFPTSEIAADHQWWYVQGAVSEDFFVKYAMEFAQKFPDKPANAQLQGQLMKTFGRRQEVGKALKFLQEQPYPSAYGYLELAKIWFQSDTSQEHGLPYIQKALQIAYNPPIQHKPVHITDVEWRTETKAIIPAIYNVMGAMYYQMNRDDEALAALQQVVKETNNNALKDTYMQMIAILRKKGRTQEAIAVATQATLALPTDEEVGKQHRALFDTLMTPPFGLLLYAQERKFWVDSSARARQYQRSSVRLNLSAIDGAITQLDGRRVTFEEMKGRPVVITFWSSWCEPCIKSLPFLQFVYQKYREKVVFLTVNVWEETGKDRMKAVREFLDKNKFSMPFCVDPTDDLIKKIGVTGLPLRVYLDKNGRVQYKEFGFQDPNQFKDNMEDTIELLLGEDFYAKK